MSNPLVSVIIPTYNRRGYLIEAIDSVLAQTYQDFEVIVVDDGSTDGTGEALAARYGDKIRYVWQENQGESAARNTGVKFSHGKYLALLDSDDIWYPSKLAQQIKWFEQRDCVGFVTCLGEAIDSGGRVIEELTYGKKALEIPLNFEMLYQDYMVGNTSCVVIRRDIFELVGGFDQRIRYGEDWDLFLQIASIAEFENIPEVLVGMRIHVGGQWYHPKPERTSRVLHDHLLILEKGYKVWPNRSEDAYEIRDRMVANEYAHAALEYYTFGLDREGHEKMRQAIKMDPVRWYCFTETRPIVYRLAWTLGDLHPDDDTRALRCIKEVLGSLHDLDPNLIPDYEKNLAQLLLELGYYYADKRQRKKAARLFVEAMRMNPSLLRNRGHQFAITRVFFGNSIANFAQSANKTIRI